MSVLVGLICIPIICHAFDMAIHCRLYFHLSNDELIEQFPYDEYLTSVSFTDFDTLQEHREYLQYFKKSGERYKTIGDDFLYFLGEHFLKYYPITHQSVMKKITIAESYLLFDSKIQGERFLS